MGVIWVRFRETMKSKERAELLAVEQTATNMLRFACFFAEIGSWKKLFETLTPLREGCKFVCFFSTCPFFSCCALTAGTCYYVHDDRLTWTTGCLNEPKRGEMDVSRMCAVGVIAPTCRAKGFGSILVLGSVDNYVLIAKIRNVQYRPRQTNPINMVHAWCILDFFNEVVLYVNDMSMALVQWAVSYPRSPVDTCLMSF